jgi:hypothetical protein
MSMSYITFQQMETGRILGMPYNATTKESLLEDTLLHYTSCGDMLKMLDDLPTEAFVARERKFVDAEIRDMEFDCSA